MAMINVQKIPDNLYRQFKSLCVLQNKTVKEVFIEMMKEWIEKGKKKEGSK